MSDISSIEQYIEGKARALALEEASYVPGYFPTQVWSMETTGLDKNGTETRLSGEMMIKALQKMMEEYYVSVFRDKEIRRIIEAAAKFQARDGEGKINNG